MSYHFFVRSNITFGRGSLSNLSEIIGKYDLRSVMIVYGKGVETAGIADKVIAEVAKAGVSYCIFDGVIPNPTNEVVEEAATIAKAERVDGFVAVGGGSSIDLAKAVNVLMTNRGRIWAYGGIGMVKNPCLPLVAIPTTAGTSSEITNVSALIDTGKVVKYVVIDDNIVPSDVIADPELTRTVPRSVTASSDMDAREQMMLGVSLPASISRTPTSASFTASPIRSARIYYNAESCPEKMVELAETMGLCPSGDLEKDKYLLSEALLDLTGTLGIKNGFGMRLGEKTTVFAWVKGAASAIRDFRLCV